MAGEPEVRRTVRRVAECAAALLASLDEAGRAAVQRPFPDERVRRDWSYVPRRRAGPALDELTRPQRKAVQRLLAASLAFPAYAQVAAVMALEDVLDEAEGGARGSAGATPTTCWSSATPRTLTRGGGASRATPTGRCT